MDAQQIWESRPLTAVEAAQAAQAVRGSHKKGFLKVFRLALADSSIDRHVRLEASVAIATHKKDKRDARIAKRKRI